MAVGLSAGVSMPAVISQSASARRDRRAHKSQGSGVVLGRNILAGVIRHEGRRDQADNGARGNENRDRIAAMVSGEQRRRDQWRRAAGDDGGELIAERRTAI